MAGLPQVVVPLVTGNVRMAGLPKVLSGAWNSTPRLKGYGCGQSASSGNEPVTT